MCRNEYKIYIVCVHVDNNNIIACIMGTLMVVLTLSSLNIDCRMEMVMSVEDSRTKEYVFAISLSLP